MSVRHWVALMIFPALGACRSPVAQEQTPAGTLSATLSGAIAESFHAEGPEPPPTSAPVTFASARTGVQPGALAVLGFRAREGLQDALLLDVRGVTGAGVYPADGSLQYGMNGDFTVGKIFVLVSGEVQLTAISSDRLRGTFAGIAVTIHSPFIGPPPDTVRITAGTFDVPVLPVRR